MLYLQIASPKSSVLNFLDSNSFEVIISIFQRTEKVPDMERLLNFDYITKAECFFMFDRLGKHWYHNAALLFNFTPIIPNSI